MNIKTSGVEINRIERIGMFHFCLFLVFEIIFCLKNQQNNPLPLQPTQHVGSHFIHHIKSFLPHPMYYPKIINITIISTTKTKPHLISSFSQNSPNRCTLPYPRVRPWPHIGPCFKRGGHGGPIESKKSCGGDCEVDQSKEACRACYFDRGDPREW